MLKVKLIDVWDAKDVLVDLFLDGISDKIHSTITISNEGLKTIKDVESMKIEDFPPETLVDGIEFRQIDSSPITAFKLGLIMSSYTHEVL